MANYNDLKTAIDAVIKTNGRQEISGAALNTQLKNMIAELGAGYQFMGIATPATNPGTPDANVFYLASEAGTYTNFGGIVINDGEVCALVWNGTWTKEVTGIASADKLNQLGQEVVNLGVFNLTDYKNAQGQTAYYSTIEDAAPAVPTKFRRHGMIILFARDINLKDFVAWQFIGNTGNWESISYINNWKQLSIRMFSVTGEKGYIIDSVGNLVATPSAKISELLHLPTQNCTFYGLWQGSNINQIVFLDESLNFLGGITSSYIYKWDISNPPSVPTGAKYIVLQTNEGGIFIDSNEQVATGVPFLYARQNKDAINDISNKIVGLNGKVGLMDSYSVSIPTFSTISGKYIDSSGNLSSFNSASMSSPIRVYEGTRIRTTIQVNSAFAPIAKKTTSGYSVVAPFVNQQTEYEYIADETCEVVVSFLTAGGVTIEIDGNVIGSLAEDIFKIENNFKNYIKEKELLQTYNLINPATIQDGYYLSDANGEQLPKNNSWAGSFVTDFIAVNEGETYFYWLAPSADGSIPPYSKHFYDENKDWVSSAPFTKISDTQYKVTIPSNVKYIRFCWLIVSGTYSIDNCLKSAVFISPSVWTPTHYEGYNTKIKNSFIPEIYDIVNEGNVLFQKKWVSCGDSFTAGDFSGMSAENYKFPNGLYAGEKMVYPFFIGRRNRMNIVNEAIGGSTMTYIDGNHNEFSAANGRYTQIDADADYITFWFGINDAGNNVPLGEIDDAVNTTFYGAWNIVLSWIITNRPNAKLGIIVTNACSTAFVNAIKDVAEKYGIPYLDIAAGANVPYYFYNEQKTNVLSSIKTLRNEQYRVSASNLHPNPACHSFQSVFIESWLRTL